MCDALLQFGSLVGRQLEVGQVAGAVLGRVIVPELGLHQERAQQRVGHERTRQAENQGQGRVRRDAVREDGRTSDVLLI